MLSGGFHLKVMIQFITMLQVMPSYKVIVKDVFCNCEPKNVCILMDTDKKYQDLKLYYMQQSK